MFCWVYFDFFSCTDEMIYLVLYILWFILIVLLFLSALDNAVSVSLALINNYYYYECFCWVQPIPYLNT